MRKMTAMITGVALACGVAVSAGAQRAGQMGPMRGGRGMMGRGGAALGVMAQRQLFRGITLSDTQKTELQKVRQANQTRMQALAKSAQTDRQALRTARQNGDTVALNAARHRVRGLMNKRIALRGELQRNVRGVLTPDQRKVFDSNRTRLEQRMTRAGRMMRLERTRMRHGAMMRALAPNRGRFMMRGGRGMMGRGGFMPGRGMQMRPGRGFGPGAGMRMAPGRGFGPGAGMRMAPGRGGFAPRMQRGGRAAPPDTTGTTGSGN